MNNFFKKQRETITIIAYICIVVVLVYFVILPLLLKIKGVNDQIQEGKMKQEIAGQQLEELPKIQQQYDMLQENEGSVNVLLDKDNAVIIIERLEKLAEDSGNKIEISIQNSQIQKNSAIATDKTATLINALPSTDYLQIQILLTGDYNKIVHFVDKLENIEYYSDIIGIKIRQSDPAANTGVADPFGSSSLTNSNKILDKVNPGDLVSTLDVVFYTKK